LKAVSRNTNKFLFKEMHHSRIWGA
jgi:hypothetical protein